MEPVTPLGLRGVDVTEHDVRFPTLANTASVRFYAGQFDPQDDGRFSIAFEAGGERGVIEGDVLDDGTTWLHIASGPGKISSKRIVLPAD